MEKQLLWFGGAAFVAFLGYQLLNSFRDIGESVRYVQRERKPWEME